MYLGFFTQGPVSSTEKACSPKEKLNPRDAADAPEKISKEAKRKKQALTIRDLSTSLVA